MAFGGSSCLKGGYRGFFTLFQQESRGSQGCRPSSRWSSVGLAVTCWAGLHRASLWACVARPTASALRHNHTNSSVSLSLPLLCSTNLSWPPSHYLLPHISKTTAIWVSSRPCFALRERYSVSSLRVTVLPRVSSNTRKHCLMFCPEFSCLCQKSNSIPVTSSARSRSLQVIKAGF